ncbi:multicopper oxidase family protein [uncultured Jannaschia sp.]|uniref:multicopper oxidase family protein n=1 Tax=uncultured Jannaschia sp. TaxID=293347 RepID=UPI00260CD8F9|nr:multicopper oxidase family protein [uncultured Jannaschia sp.]
MTLTRRRFGALIAASAVLPALPRRARAAPDPIVIEARPGTAQLLPPPYPATPVWSYDGAAPGAGIRMVQGERLERRLLNALPEPTSIHWHGLRLPNGMDGVAGVTQAPVAPGESFDYAFDLPDAGTYWYHAHRSSAGQVGRGLHAPLIVEEPVGARPDVDDEVVAMLGDWRLREDGTQAEDFLAPHDASHGGRFGNVVTTNGRIAPSHSVRRGDRLRLRLINAANARIFEPALQGMTGWIVALDGMPLPAPRPLESLVLAPAQRADVIADVTAEAGEEALLIRLDREPAVQMAFPVREGTATTRPAPASLPPNPVPALGALDGARPLRLVMEGGAMGRMGGALMGGRRAGFREIAGAGYYWAFNGRADWTAEGAMAPLVEVAAGETVHLAIENRSNWPHAMHLHGMHFHEVAGGAPGDLRDTTLVPGGATAEVAFRAAAPGDWMLHCHMLGHAASGMTGFLRVAA